MIIFKSYSGIKGFLKRFTLLKIGNIHIRLHRNVNKNTLTLFISDGKYKWSAINKEVSNISDGIYQRVINDKILYCKVINGIWFIGNSDIEISRNENRHSIHQCLKIKIYMFNLSGSNPKVLMAFGIFMILTSILIFIFLNISYLFRKDRSIGYKQYCFIPTIYENLSIYILKVYMYVSIGSVLLVTFITYCLYLILSYL